MKNLSVFSLIFLALGASAETPIPADNYSTCKEVSCSSDIVNKFNIHPSFFGGHYIYSDTVYAAKDVKNERLLFNPTSPVTMFNARTGTIYQPGSDFIISKDKVTFPEGSSVDFAPSEFSKPDKEDKNFNIKVTLEYPYHQVSASYQKNEHLKLKISGAINDLRDYIRVEKKLSATFYGDSITFGSNASDSYEQPHQPPYVGLVSAYMSLIKGGNFNWYNPSVAGWNTNNAVSDITGRLIKHDSGIYVIAFGMNDSTDVIPEVYISNIEKLIIKIKSKNQNSRIVLMSSTLPNPEWVLPRKEYFSKYSEGLKVLSNKYDNTVFVDITDVWVQILKRKNIYAITSNGANHPADFGHRIIAEALLTTFLGSKFY